MYTITEVDDEILRPPPTVQLKIPPSCYGSYPLGFIARGVVHNRLSSRQNFILPHSLRQHRTFANRAKAALKLPLSNSVNILVTEVYHRSCDDGGGVDDVISVTDVDSSNLRHVTTVVNNNCCGHCQHDDDADDSYDDADDDVDGNVDDDVVIVLVIL